MRKFVACLALMCSLVAVAQQKNFSYKFYGQIRTDLFYNSRSNAELVDGLFHMYPLDVRPDANGDDLNDNPEGNFYTMYTRLGLDMTGPEIGKGVKTAAKVEVDFRGGGTTFYVIRLRQAYFRLAYKDVSLLMGQAWHPFFGDVSPQVLNLNTGAPFQPFSRAPQVAFTYASPVGLRVKLTALWQSQYSSVGPKSNVTGETGYMKSYKFLKYGCVPEFALNLDYERNGFLAGVGMDLLSIVPRREAQLKDKIYKVDERITTVSAEAHLRWKNDNWFVAAKTVLGQNFTQGCGVGGYAITGIDPKNGSQTYAPVKVSSSWLNVVYGKKWRPGLFLGYLKNHGTDEPVLGVLGTGVGEGLDKVATASAELSYNLPHWRFGVEYTFTRAWYGDLGEEAKPVSLHSLDNHRFLFMAQFQF